VTLGADEMDKFSLADNTNGNGSTDDGSIQVLNLKEFQRSDSLVDDFLKNFMKTSNHFEYGK